MAYYDLFFDLGLPNPTLGRRGSNGLQSLKIQLEMKEKVPLTTPIFGLIQNQDRGDIFLKYKYFKIFQPLHYKYFSLYKDGDNNGSL